MAEKDLVEKKLEDHNDVFADIWNTLLFGKKVLLEEKLSGQPEPDHHARAEFQQPEMGLAADVIDK